MNTRRDLLPRHAAPQQEDWHAFNFVVDVCFMLDLVARFLTAYHDEYADRMVYEPVAIARHYSRGLLVFDLIASVPLTIVSFAASEPPPYRFSLCLVCCSVGISRAL